MKEKIKKVSLRDICGLVPFLIMVLPSFIYKIYLKITKKELWLIAETENMARDNGYAFFKYMRENHSDIKCYYAINFNCHDYEKVKSLGNIIKWSSFNHYFYYMSSTRNISSHKEGNPNQTIFTFMHLYLKLYNNRVFLQHGVLYQNYSMFHQCNTKFSIFITGAKPEYDFVKEKYGYNNDEVKYTGLARFDNLNNVEANPKIILYMPTWRRWIESENELKVSEYYHGIESLINNSKLEEILEKNDMYLYFCPHNSMQKYKDSFITINNRVKVIDLEKVDIQNLLMIGSLLITDFSSIHTDFAYMNKPIIYYQYDTDDFKSKHIGKNADDTYYNFVKDGFGSVVNNENDLIEAINLKIKSKFKQEKIYNKRVSIFFPLRDNKNSERIFKAIIGG